jgi:hypothetical protein
MPMIAFPLTSIDAHGTAVQRRAMGVGATAG